MPISIPTTIKYLFDRIRADAQEELSTVNVYVRNNLLSSLFVAVAGRFKSFYQTYLTGIDDAAIPTTSKDEYLIEWANLKSVYRLPASIASGSVNFKASAIATIPQSSIIRDQNSLEYIVLNDSTSIVSNINIISLIRLGSTATATTSSNHGLASGQTVGVSGALPSTYNGTFIIQSISSTSFTYTVSGSPTSPATGSPIVTSQYVKVSVESLTTGNVYNQDSGSILSLSTPIKNVSDSGFVDTDGLSGGSDLESEIDFRDRMTFAYQEPISYFSKSFLELKARDYQFVDRVFVLETYPSVGCASVYFTSSNSINSIPSLQEVNILNTYLQSFRPAHVDVSDFIVAGPTPVVVNITINGLLPNNSSLKIAVQENLLEYFNDELILGEDVTVRKIESIIYRTVDPESNIRVNDFTITTPNPTVVVGTTQKAVLGAVSFT